MPSGKTLTHKVEVACQGAEAKALGKHRLEKELGLNVTFQSYQEAPGKQKLWLEDDDPVISGSVLNFTVEMMAVLHQQYTHTKILAMLSRPLLQDGGAAREWCTGAAVREISCRMPDCPTP